ncbi:hypothetical protein [Brevundimonas sp.]|uniref:hypothetical protein n=1 Tax=Brevundimonas sp. TaxID=1871086 RepID=UPI002ABA3CB0|nr:hypothetical protein [Brevundimonas sp.]MDZ4363173.1 hypothetical protein [Brevundimonas sp.]
MAACKFYSESSFSRIIFILISAVSISSCINYQRLVVTAVYSAPIIALEINPSSRNANIIETALVVEFRLSRNSDDQFDTESGTAKLSICGPLSEKIHMPSLIHRNKDGKLLAVFPYYRHERTWMDGPVARLGWQDSQIAEYGECFSVSQGGVAWKTYQSKPVKIRYAY